MMKSAMSNAKSRKSNGGANANAVIDNSTAANNATNTTSGGSQDRSGKVYRRAMRMGGGGGGGGGTRKVSWENDVQVAVKGDNSESKVAAAV